jgi:DNA-binding CsgD family transcriptional regulator
MAKRDELNDRAILVASLRRKKMSVANIALYLHVSERQVYHYLNRAQELYRILAKTRDSEKYLGERLQVFTEMEQEALAKFSLMDPKSSVALGYLNAARDASKEIKKLLLEAGLIQKMPEQIKGSGLPLGNDKVRAAAYDLLKLAREESKKKAETENS